ncbi:MAG: methyltransferase domain-containing protein [Ruminococcaceae bacterium]|nr:methyltransferase domain-containing protein [Oscillospiraceae bacterium]
MDLFICPHCKLPLSLEGKSLKCENGHLFDVAKEGYVNLLPPNKMNSKLPGDSKEMVEARRSFLEKGYYSLLCRELCRECVALLSGKREAFVTDFGCGEGYYTESIAESILNAGIKLSLAGVDISKNAVKLAAKRKGRASYAVASVYGMPLPDGCADLALNIFSPLALDELKRVVKKDGYFVYVVPSEKHLWEMKQTVYKEPYKNKSERIEYEGFELINTVAVRYEAFLNTREDISALFGMTPYFWRSPKEGAEKLLSLDSLTCSIGFDIHVYKRKAD